MSVGNCTIGESTWGGLWEDMEITKTAPVGVFDSGVGGLTVAREIMRQLPDENIVYFGDTARVPYGSKSKENIIRFSRIFNFFLTKIRSRTTYK